MSLLSVQFLQVKKEYVFGQVKVQGKDEFSPFHSLQTYIVFLCQIGRGRRRLKGKFRARFRSCFWISFTKGAALSTFLPSSWGSKMLPGWMAAWMGDASQFTCASVSRLAAFPGRLLWPASSSSHWGPCILADEESKGITESAHPDLHTMSGIPSLLAPSPTNVVFTKPPNIY